MLAIAMLVDETNRHKPDLPRWIRCPACQGAAVIIDEVIYPGTKPLREPLGVPETDRRIWSEIRTCLGVGANAAAVMLCRKMLFHIAVANGLPAKKANNRAPTYTEAVNHLESEGVITKKMRPWVDRVKEVGNDANHELTPIEAEVALDVATFTEQLLVLAYELDALQADPSKALEPSDGATPESSEASS